MEFRILGSLEVVEGGRALSLGGRPRALLAFFLLHGNELVSSERLIDALWGERPPETAQAALQVHVSQLRKRLGVDRIQTRAPGYLLRLERHELDASRFEDLLRTRRLHSGVAPRSPTSATSPGRKRRARASTSCGSQRSRNESRRISQPVATPSWSLSWSHSSASNHCASGCAPS